MKDKSIFINLTLTLFMVTSLFMSCSSSESAESQITSINLSANANGGIVNDEFTFMVEDNGGNNITSEASITIDGSALTSNPYTFSQKGVYIIVATYSDLTSNTLNIIIDQEESITLTYSPNPPVENKMAYFVVTNNLGNNVTSSTALSVGSSEISNPYMFTATGDYEVEAAYNGFTDSQTITVARGFTKKALLEDFTGTWCPNCPPAAAAVSNAVATDPNVFGVGYHVGASSYPDPMEIAETSYWSDIYNVTGFPTVYVNGPDTRWNFPSQSQISSELDEDASLGLALSAEIVGGLLNLEVTVAFNKIPSEELQLMVYLIEDNVTTNSAQAGSSQGADYVHRDVLRKVYTDQLGDLIPAGSISFTSNYTKTLSGLALPSNIDDMSQLKVIAFVRNTYTKTFTDYFGTDHVNSPHYDIYNVQEVHMGETADFD
jgi:hypothetical protein